MNTNAIKRYAPKARIAFIAAMTKQAARYGITVKGIEPLEQKGDLALIGERAFPASIARPRAALARRVEQLGFAQAMEQAAYSWFNRLCALRYMEIKGYLDHGRRVLSAADGSVGVPQILDECLDIELEGLDKARITELKLDGTKDEELYRELLLAQCHALHQAMPFLFEMLDDALELLLPDNLTKTDSLIRELVAAIPEGDWHNVEIIGWLYQFYISEKKDQVIGKVVKSEDIPAATQLFTPNWIVQYLVQNSVGRQWLQTYPDSPLKAKWDYYVAPGEQTPEVQAQLAASTPDSIDPLTIKVLDPACGSGHILVEAYKVLKEIYTERGFRARDIPQLILENNLFGLDIDDRAGQLAGFALMMLAREDDRRIFGRELKLNVLALQESSHLNMNTLWKALNLTSDWQRGQSQGLFDSEQSDLSAAQADNRYQLLKTTLARFTQAKTFGSLIEVPAENAEPLGELLKQLRQLAKDGDSMQKPAAQQLLPYVQQAWILAQRYDAVIANPPYMGTKAMNEKLSDWLKENYKNVKSDLFSAFVVKCSELSRVRGSVGIMSPNVWMSLSSHEKLRQFLTQKNTLTNLVELPLTGFKGATVQICAYTFEKKYFPDLLASFIRLVNFKGGDEEMSTYTRQAIVKNDHDWFYRVSTSDFSSIPGQPIAYWAGKKLKSSFSLYKSIGEIAKPRQGMATTNNELFLRMWSEVKYSRICFDADSEIDAQERGAKWFPYNKGGPYRKWYGNFSHIVNFENNGKEICSYIDSTPGARVGSNGRVINREYYFKEGITWSDIKTGGFGARLSPKGFIFDIKGSSGFPSEENRLSVLGLLSSTLTTAYMGILNPTVTFQVGDISRIPYRRVDVDGVVKRLTELSKLDWDFYEISWGFSSHPIINTDHNRSSLPGSYLRLGSYWQEMTQEVRRLEEKNNRLFIDAYGLQDELTPEAPLEEITLTCNPHYRYGGNKSEAELEIMLQCDTMGELVSYAIGCMMGRYSLDKPGLILASQGETLQDYLSQIPAPRFAPDGDAILPLTDQEWFANDATNRFREFVRTVWGEEHLQENLDFVAESLCLYAIKPKRGESALDTIRRYLSTQFFKDHLKTYKKRPIYWLFSSGKHKAFECLVYLHRYNEGTLARMRTEYVIPLTAKLNTYANKLEQDIDASTSTAEKKRLEKELTTLHNQQAELATFDEKLRHYADQRISLDLDDGVKVNYGEFGDLLDSVKIVTGGASND
ncbi:BREX-1 system adenine-specific DNA-methyltransferase PglX [Azotobacter salinestris]|uniref:BREX-1 system adenine-specific DNA-methyltransferase PglX n=1 Tax=Azotobacter salinestris TaxID=69964 RepID=UPI0012669CC6|nr:BREX-1 system adenine-specific DNA-methyltransferase PglX [Azotobacter salinestris]